LIGRKEVTLAWASVKDAYGTEPTGGLRTKRIEKVPGGEREAREKQTKEEGEREMIGPDDRKKGAKGGTALRVLTPFGVGQEETCKVGEPRRRVDQFSQEKNIQMKEREGLVVRQERTRLKKAARKKQHSL